MEGDRASMRAWAAALSIALVTGCGGGGGGDGGGGSTVVGGGGNSTANASPTADAAADQSVQEGDTVTLDGSGSSDPEGSTLTYTWSQIDGPSVTLSDPAVAQPQFAAPTLATGETEISLGFELVVSDGSASSAPETVAITVHLPTLVDFDPAAGTMAPTNYFFAGSVDGTLNIPGYDDNLNMLDGYSTVTAARIDFQGRLDRDSVAAGENVRVFAVVIDSDTREVLSIEGELEPVVTSGARWQRLRGSLQRRLPGRARW